MSGRPPKLGTCCICGGSSKVRNVIMLEKLCPMPGRGWGCLVCCLPSNGAIAVVCNPCIEQRRGDTRDVVRDLRWACRGFAGRDGRVEIGTLEGRFDHDLSMHREVSHRTFFVEATDETPSDET